MRAGEEIRPVRAAGSGWIVKDRTRGRRGFRRPRDESNPVGGGARLNGRIFSSAGARRHCPGFKGAGRWGAGRQAGSGNSAGGVGALWRAAPGSLPPPPPNPPTSRERAKCWPSSAEPLQGQRPADSTSSSSPDPTAPVRPPSSTVSCVSGRRRKILPHRGRGTASSRWRGPAADPVSDAGDGAIGPTSRSGVSPSVTARNRAAPPPPSGEDLQRRNCTLYLFYVSAKDHPEACTGAAAVP